MKKWKLLSINLLVGSTCFVVTAAMAAEYESNVLGKAAQENESSDAYWTQERLANVKPFPLPTVTPEKIHQSHPKYFSQFDAADGTLPDPSIKPRRNIIISYQSPQQSAFMAMLDEGSSDEPYTSSRLVPLSADLSYPYRAIGKLFFTIPGKGDYVCSASVIGQRIVLTAGHCVHSGANAANGFYTNFLFVPAYRDGNAPFLTWKYAYVITTSTWATGNGNVPNAADYGMLEIKDNLVNGVAKNIAKYTGTLGFQTNSLTPNHAHLLGYPCNLDACSKMHQVASQSARTITPNNVEYGSDMGGGSSGGPWIQNFGDVASGQTGGANAGRNRVIGVTSWGYNDERMQSQGAANFDDRFTTMFSAICRHLTGNCS